MDETGSGAGRGTGGLALAWRDGDMPYSEAFGDHFHARSDGLGESRHVFLAGNGLPHRWAGAADFVVAELGFGTGLNLLATWDAWRRTRLPGASLTYVTFEAWPMPADDMARALAKWTELRDLTAPLTAAWSRSFCRSTECRIPTAAGLQLDPQTDLAVIVGDARATVPHWQGGADAWYLDGFAPARNPEMWSSELVASVARHTRPGGTFATYAAAGWVRRNLVSAGFQVERRQGFGGKREMLCGSLPATQTPTE